MDKQKTPSANRSDILFFQHIDDTLKEQTICNNEADEELL
jgi:hypothetical protein